MSIPLRLAFALALTFSCLSGHVLAQGFPAKPIRLLAYSGGAVEALMRQVGVPPTETASIALSSREVNGCSDCLDGEWRRGCDC